MKIVWKDGTRRISCSMIKCLRLRYASGLAGFISQENRLKNHIHTIYGVTRQPA